MQNLKFTGERLVPISHIKTFGDLEHINRYAFAQQFAHDKIVLDIASGEGYGTNLLGASAKKVFGVDISKEAIENALLNYKADNLEFLLGSTDAIPISSKAIDVVVSFETIEHHDRHTEMLCEIKRVLKNDGILIISTPIKSNYIKREPDNPFHVKELEYNEFEGLLLQYFKYVKMFTQKIIMGSVVLSTNNEKSHLSQYSGDFKKIDRKLHEKKIFNTAYFTIAICSDSDIPHLNDFCFFDGSDIFINNNAKYFSIINSLEYKIAKLITYPFRKLKRIINR